MHEVDLHQAIDIEHQKRIDKITRFYDDEFIKALNKQIMNIYSCSLPRMIIYKSGIMSTEHSYEVKEAVSKIESLKNEYIESHYGKEFIVKITEQ